MLCAAVPKRSLAIAKELATLATNIPVAFDGSIFLRVDEERVDVIKVCCAIRCVGRFKQLIAGSPQALIIGPADTPYSNGCFLFDIFLPSKLVAARWTKLSRNNLADRAFTLTATTHHRPRSRR